MKITFPDGLTIEADSLTDVIALYAVLKPAPNASKSACPRDPETEDLRLTYQRKYGKRFTMKSRKGMAINFLSALHAAGWPPNGCKVKSVAGLS